MSEARELRVALPGTLGEVSALFERPSDAWVSLLLAHGAGAGMRHEFMENLAATLCARGVAVLRFQFLYMERGRRAPDPERVRLATVAAAGAVGRSVSDSLPLFAGGKSMGGRMTSLAASKDMLGDLRGLVFFGFPLHAARKPAATRGVHLANVAPPMLFLQGEKDAMADLGIFAPLVESLAPRGRLHVVAGADHGFHVPKSSGRSHEDVIAELAEKAAHWMRSVLHAR